MPTHDKHIGGTSGSNHLRDAAAHLDSEIKRHRFLEHVANNGEKGHEHFAKLAKGTEQAQMYKQKALASKERAAAHRDKAEEYEDLAMYGKRAPKYTSW